MLDILVNLLTSVSHAVHFIILGVAIAYLLEHKLGYRSTGFFLRQAVYFGALSEVFSIFFLLESISSMDFADILLYLTTITLGFMPLYVLSRKK